MSGTGTGGRVDQWEGGIEEELLGRVLDTLLREDAYKLRSRARTVRRADGDWLRIALEGGESVLLPVEGEGFQCEIRARRPVRLECGRSAPDGVAPPIGRYAVECDAGPKDPEGSLGPGGPEPSRVEGDLRARGGERCAGPGAAEPDRIEPRRAGPGCAGHGGCGRSAPDGVAPPIGRYAVERDAGPKDPEGSLGPGGPEPSRVEGDLRARGGE
ncbi:hypothetical protein ABZS87_31315, partial [Streptomyces sp. NPDC005336]